MSTHSTSIFNDPNVAKHLSLLHDKYVIVSADKAPNNIEKNFIHFQYLYPFWTPKYNFLFRKCRRGICRVAKWIVNT
jgi:hypothetical protein